VRIAVARPAFNDALPLYKKYTDIFLMDDVLEEERKAVARQVTDKIIAKLSKTNQSLSHRRIMRESYRSTGLALDSAFRSALQSQCDSRQK
jgi:hypothetical protein